MSAGERNLARQLQEEGQGHSSSVDRILCLLFVGMTLLGGVTLPLFVLVFIRPQFPDLADVILVAVAGVWLFVLLLWLKWRRAP